jgi:hypothetical protein
MRAGSSWVTSKPAPAALGDETLTMQEMQRVRHRLARDAELVGELVLPDALAGRRVRSEIASRIRA